MADMVGCAFMETSRATFQVLRDLLSGEQLLTHGAAKVSVCRLASSCLLPGDSRLRCAFFNTTTGTWSGLGTQQLVADLMFYCGFRQGGLAGEQVLSSQTGEPNST